MTSIHHVGTVRDNRSVPVVSALVEEGLLEPTLRNEAVDVVDRVLGGQEAVASPVKRRLAELAGYVGGAFVVSAAGLFFAAQWDVLTRGEQVGLLVGVAVLLAVACLGLGAMGAGGFAGLRSDRQPVRRRLAGVLATGGAASAAAAVGLHFDSALTGDDSPAALLGFSTLAALAVLGYLLAPTLVGQLGIAAGTATALPLLLEEVGEISPLEVGLALLGLGLVWLVLTERGWWREVASSRVIGCTLALLGAQVPVFDNADERWVAYLMLTLVAAAGFATYVVRPAWPYLAAGVVAVTLVVPEALLDWTDNALGPAGALLVTGVTLLAASVLGLRLRSEVADEQAK